MIKNTIGTNNLQTNKYSLYFKFPLLLVWVGTRQSLADLLHRHIWMPSWSVHWVLIWLNLSTSSPVCLPLCLQLSGFIAQGSDWLTSARLACIFMHAGLIISPWPWIYPALPTFTPFYVSFLSPCIMSRCPRLVHVPPLSGFSCLVLFALSLQLLLTSSMWRISR